MSRKIHSLKVESVLALLIAAAISGVFLLGLYELGTKLLDSYFDSSNYVDEKTQECVNDLQSYVTKEGISAQNADALNVWARKQNLVSFSIYRDDVLLYDSFYEGDGGALEEDTADVYYGDKHYTLTFSDGSTDLYLIGFFEYRFIIMHCLLR